MNTTTIGGDWVGRVIDGRFPLLQWLGGSETSGVFLTELDGPGSQRVVIKLILADYAGAEGRIADWAAMSSLTHPHLMRLLHTGRSQVDTTGLVYCVTEYAEEVLAEILEARPLQPNEVKDMLVPVLDALFYLHGKGFVHGHLKPSNILVVRNHLQLSVDGLEVAGKPGRHFGALSVYDAPEVWDEDMTTAADVWSLGMTLVQALTQHAPVWERESGKEPMVPAGVPQPFARMARESLRLDPARRCTLTDLNKARFEEVRYTPGPEKKAGAPVAARPVEAVEAKPQGRRRGLMAAVLVVLLLAIFAVIYLWPNGTGTPRPVETRQAAPVAGAVAGPGEAAKAQKETPVMPKKQAQESTAASVRTAGAAEPGAKTAPEAVATGGVVARVIPDAPQAALDTIHGTVQVWVRVAVDANGNVSGATFEDAGPSKYFARLAMDAAQKWRFEPGAPGAWRLAFQFRQTGVEVVPTEMGQ
jgi:TonB family protein